MNLRHLNFRWLGAVVLSATLLGSGCTLQDVPLPSIAPGDKYEVTAVFEGALGLPMQAAVKMDGAIVGEVAGVKAVDYTAEVTLAIVEDVELPANVGAQVRFGSPMGEAFVEITSPDQPRGRLKPGARIGKEVTSEAASVGDLLASVSALATGGNFADVKIVIEELNIALRDQAPNLQRILSRLDRITTSLNQRTEQFDRALDAADRLTREMAGDRALFASALQRYQPAIRTLNAEREEILDLMTQLRRLGGVGTETVQKVRADLLSVLADLGPILDTLTRNEKNFPAIFDGIAAFGGQTESATKGLFLNFDLTSIFSAEAASSLPIPIAVPAPRQAARAKPTQPRPQDPLAPVTGLLDDLLGGLVGKGGQSEKPEQPKGLLGGLLGGR